MTGGPITRSDYQAKRLAFLRQLLDPAVSQGLEIGACDLPTVSASIGPCEFADYLSTEDLIRRWNLPASTVAPVSFVVDRAVPPEKQIAKRFDYVVACHVLEHVTNPIGYIEELSRLLKPGSGIMILVVPDKRWTPDVARPTTTVEHLLSDYYEGCRYPSIEHIMEFAKHWVPELKAKSESSASDFYQWACTNHRSGGADVHCHVWTDEEFFEQFDWLIRGGLLNGLSIAAKQMTPSGYNEFTLALRAERR